MVTKIKLVVNFRISPRCLHGKTWPLQSIDVQSYSSMNPKFDLDKLVDTSFYNLVEMVYNKSLQMLSNRGSNLYIAIINKCI